MATGGLENSNRGNASDFIGECFVTRSCEPCMKTNIAKAAYVFCKDCNEFLCETCRNPHIVYKPGNHDMVSMQDTAVIDMKRMDKCSEHDKGF
ncbi:hypothetical protein DPMN_133917 [Dreissena polymorpha]|uniref:B box-type domain-containing protein n=1 Tax=Dreissena polymorpha TaxID=45954 RepID=A0A9D4JFA8_DREPO|nr:hypothetical protein DPMN_133917 [Dreissena polymorpha]